MNGIRLCGVFAGLIVGPCVGLAALPNPTLPMMPPSIEKTWPRSNPGVFVGVPLKSRQEIWSSVTEFSEEVLGAGKEESLMLALASGGARQTCGSCLGEMASECRGGWVCFGADDCGKANFSKTGSDLPRVSSVESSVGALAWLASYMLRWRSAVRVWFGAGVVGFAIRAI